MKKEMKNLKKAIKELNAPIVIDGESLDSNFNFKIRESEGRIEVFDSNECYYMYYAEDCYWGMKDLAKEFGIDPPTEMRDTVHEKLETAVKADFGKDSYLEWQDSVIMLVCE